MPPRESRQKTLHYKRAEIVGGDARPVSDLLIDAVSREQRPLHRAERRGHERDDVRVLNRPYTHNGLVCGCLLTFTEGNHQPTIKLDEEEIELAIDQIAPRAQEQFIEGMLFFGLKGHHVILLQSKGLRSAALEQHLNWLFLESTHVLPDGARVVLRDEPSREARERLQGVKSVVLRAPVSLDILRQRPEDIPNRHAIVRAVTREVWDAMRASGTFLEDLSADQALAFEDVEISLEIRRKGRAPEGRSLIDELAHALRHADDDVFELTTKSGKVLKSGELKLTANKSVKTRNGMPILADVAEKMYDWLATLIDDRQVSEV